MSQDQNVLQQLMEVIVDRKRRRPAGSYTVTLLDGGAEAIGAKIREEADELIEAARSARQDRRAVIHEAADLFYHVLVMLGHCDVRLAEVEEELARRFGTSGLEEKASRPKGDQP